MMSQIEIAKNPTRAASLLAILAALLLTPTAVQANNAGFAGAGTGCTPCHGAVADAGTTVSITGPANLNLGGTGFYQLTITGGAAANAGGALNVATNGGTLGANQAATQVSGGTITHNPGNPANAGVFSFNFTLTAPGAPATVVLSGAGMGWSGNFAPDTGDLWNTTQFTVNVPEPATGLMLGTGLVALVVAARRRRA